MVSTVAVVVVAIVVVVVAEVDIDVVVVPLAPVLGVSVVVGTSFFFSAEKNRGNQFNFCVFVHSVL